MILKNLLIINKEKEILISRVKILEEKDDEASKLELKKIRTKIYNW